MITSLVPAFAHRNTLSTKNNTVPQCSGLHRISTHRTDDRFISSSTLVNQQIQVLYEQHKADLKADIAKAINAKDTKQKKAINNLVNLIVESQGFQNHFKARMLQSLKETSHLMQRNSKNTKKANVRFSGDSVWDWVTEPVQTSKNKGMEIARGSADAALNTLLTPESQKKLSTYGSGVTNEIVDNTLTKERQEAMSQYCSDIMYGAYAKTRQRIVNDVLHYCSDNAVPLSLIACGTMLPGTLGQTVAAGGLQLLLPEPSDKIPEDIGIGSVLTGTGMLMGSGWLSGVLAGTGLLRTYGGLCQLLGMADNALVLSVGLVGMPVAGWLLPAGAVSNGLIVGGSSPWPIALGDEAGRWLKSKKE